MWEKKRKLNKSNSFYQRIKIDLIININYNIKEEFKIKVFTEKDYFRALKLFPQIREIELKEKDNTYGIALTEEEYIKNEHDKLFKKILEIPKEVESVIRKAHESPVMKQMYEEFLQKPGSEIAHKYLHTKYTPKKLYDI